MQTSKRSHGPESDNHHDHETDFFSSSGGPYIYEHGKLKQKSDDHELKETLSQIHEKIRMDNEHYAIELIFEVATGHHN